MRICILSSFGDLMSRDTGPSVRIYNLAKHLVGIGHEVHVVIPSGEKWSKCADGIFVHGISGFYPVVCLRVFSRLLGVLRPTSILSYDLLFILRAIRTILRCDLVQIEQPSAGGFVIPLLKQVLRKPLVIDCHDAFQALRIGHTSVVRKILETFLEKNAYKFANVVLTVSEREKSFLVSYGVKQDRIEVIPNGVDTEVFKPLPDTIYVRNRYDLKDSPTIVFVGNMEYLPNQEAVHLIANGIAPKVLEEFGNVRFLIVGRGFNRLNLPTQHKLVFTGAVDNVIEALAASDVAIAPLLHGSGTRLKVLEYFACGLPVVSTSVGVEGLEVDDGLNVFIEDDIDKFADRIVVLLKDRFTAKRLGANARNVAAKKYDWRIISKRLDEIYKRVIRAIGN